jgi:hypothetical protein
MQAKNGRIRLLVLMTIVLAGCAMTTRVPPPHEAKTMEAGPMHDVWPSVTGAPKNFHPAQATHQSNRESACTANQPGGSNSSTNCF